MRKIDCFTHVIPPRYIAETAKALNVTPDATATRLATIPELQDMAARIRNMDEAGVERQVITLSWPPIESVVEDPKGAAELAKVANDGIAEIAARHPKKFIAVGAMALNNVDASMREAERCLKSLGMKGMLLYSSARGKPIDAQEFLPLYELMARSGAPLWLHPTRFASQADYPGEEASKYAIWQLFGWPFETTVAMTRLVLSGVFEKFPLLKIIVHHSGAMVPFFDKRIEHCYGLFHQLGESFPELPRPVLDYYRMFYVDTAVMGSVGALTAACAFYGADKILFGTDAPFDGEGGKKFTRETIFSIEALVVPPAEKEKIFAGNIVSLLRL